MQDVKKNEESVRSHLRQFLSRVPYLVNAVSISETTIGEIRKKKDMQDLENVGVYIFIENDCVVYVGRALGGFGYRIWDGLKASGDSSWEAVTKNEVVKLLLISFPVEEVYWAAALELFLIREMKPIFNSRLG